MGLDIPQKLKQPKRSKMARRRSLSQEQTFKCPKCPKKWVGKREAYKDWYAHVKQVHKWARVISCQSQYCCSRVFSSKAEYESHLDKEIFKYECPDCGQKFRVMVSLTSHQIRKHGSSKSKIVWREDQGLRKRAKRRRRENAEGERIQCGFKFKCEHCPKSYRFQNSLHRHIRKVHNVDVEVPDATYKCPKCPQKYVGKHPAYTRLNWHMKLKHKWPKMITCRSCCTRIFPSTKEYESHLDKRVYKYSCPDCGKRFRLKLSRQAHQIRKHPDRGKRKYERKKEKLEDVSIQGNYNTAPESVDGENEDKILIKSYWSFGSASPPKAVENSFEEEGNEHNVDGGENEVKNDDILSSLSETVLDAVTEPSEDNSCRSEAESDAKLGEYLKAHLGLGSGKAFAMLSEDDQTRIGRRLEKILGVVGDGALGALVKCAVNKQTAKRVPFQLKGKLKTRRN